jgi:hypothetical protein
MAMQFFFSISIFSVCFIFFLIAKSVKGKNPQITAYNRSESSNYLFPKISKSEVVVSNVGAMISFYVMIIGTILMSLGWGTLVGMSCILPLAVGFYCLKKLMIRYIDKGSDEYSIAAYIREEKNSKWLSIALIFFMAVFSISTIISEITAVNLLSNSLFNPVSETLSGNITSSGEVNYGYFLFISCFLYVLVGGYKGILRTDFFQMSLVAILWGALIIVLFINFEFKSLFVPVINQLSLNDSETWIVALATSMLVIGWIIGAKDNWVRILVYIEKKHPSSGADFINRRKKSVREIINWTTCLGMLVVLIPVLVGLNLRQQADDAFCKGEVESNSFVVLYKPLSVSKDNGCDLKPAHKGDNESSYVSQFTKFTNFPYKYFSYQFKSTEPSLVMWLLLVVSTSAIFAIAMTTIDTLVILLSQLLFSKNSATPPIVPISIMFAAIYIITISSAFSSPELYLSFGVFAWSNLIFLATCHVIVVFSDNSQQYPVKLILISWGIWAITSILHYFAISNENQVNIIPELFVNRSAMPIIAGVLCMVIFIRHYILKSTDVLNT